MSTSLRLDAIRASGLVVLLSRYPRLPRHAVAALPELADLHDTTIDRAVQVALDRGWVDQNDEGELTVRAPGVCT